jgi:hypothetical protein
MSCVAVKIGIKVIEGGTFSKEFLWETGNPAVAVNLTGFTAKFAIREKLTDGVALIDGVDVTDPWTADGDTGVYFNPLVTGRFMLYLNDGDVQSLCARHADIVGVYDVFLYSPAGEAVFKLYGPCKIPASVTRWP